MTVLYNQKYLKQHRRDLRKRMTQSETLLWSRLRGGQSGVRFRRQYSVGNYIVDFCCPRLKFVVELDGITHQDEKVQDHDSRKEKYLSSRGFVVLRFSDNEVLENTDSVLDVIYQRCRSIEPKNLP